MKKNKQIINKEFEEKLRKIDKSIKEGKNISPMFSSPKEINDYLDKL